MNMKRYNQWKTALLAVCILCATGCDSISMKETEEHLPQIISFAPESGSVGSEIVIVGEYLNNVVTATIGNEPVEILQRVSNQRLSLKVTSNAKSGKIVLQNALGQGVSDLDFTLEYPAPTIVRSDIPAEVEMGNKLLLSGTHINAISAVLFTAEGYTTGNEAPILSQSESEILVRIPYVESDKAFITFRYFDGSKEVQTPLVSAPQVSVARYEPKVNTTGFASVQVGEIVMLNGSYLNKIDKVLLGEIECSITLQSEEELRFSVPPSDSYQDGENTLPLKIVYFDGREVRVLTEAFVVKVPFISFWQNKKTYGQGRDVEEMASFFSPETGLVYANADWRTKVDPISYQYQAATCSASNTPAVSENEYNSVYPYFFFSGVTAGQLQINSPAGSAGQLKNFYWLNNSANEYRITGANANCYGTPVLTFLFLDPADAQHKALVEQVKSGTLEKIDEESFPLDTEAKTCAGINISGMKTSINSDVWANGIFSVGVEQKATVDAVLLLLYYNVNGSTLNVAANVKRIGFLHIKTIDFKMWNNTKAPSSSSIEFDVYWQKKDYDYSKIK